MNVSELLDRVQQDPITHLGGNSIRLWQAYLSGYEHACKKQGVPLPNEPLERDKFHHWLVHRLETTSEFRSRLNAWSSITPVSYSIFLSEDPSREIMIYQSLRTEALEDLGAVEDSNVEVAVESKVASLEGLISAMISRPVMYFGNYWSLANIRTYMNGYFSSEKDFGTENSDEYLFFLGFQQWVEQRYPFGKNIAWDKIFSLICIGADSALESFGEHLEMYKSCEPFDAMDRGMKTMIENMKKHMRPEDKE